jgi:hypothetical protein
MKCHESKVGFKVGTTKQGNLEPSVSCISDEYVQSHYYYAL